MFDYQGLNQITVKYQYPLSLVPSPLEQLHSAKVFTKFYLHSAYNLIWIREDDEWKTTLTTTSGHFEYCVMLYGFTCASSVLQCFINIILRDMLGKIVIAYILIYSPSLEIYVQHIKQVLPLRKSALKGEKFKFHVTTIWFLGYIICPERVAMVQEKVAAVTEWRTPTIFRELQRFLRFVNFYQKVHQGL